MKKIFTLFAALAMVMSMSATVQLRGTLSDWGTGLEFTGNPLTVTVDLAANTTYEFKVVVDGTWHGNSGTITDNVTGWVFDQGDNCKIKTLAAGTYTFTWDNANKSLSVAYPALQPAVYKDVTVTVTIPYALDGNTPKIYWWGADGVEDAVWEEAPEMTPASSWSTTKFSYTFEQIDCVRGINYLIICDGVQTKDLYTQEDATVWFQSSMPTVKVMGIADDWAEGMETSVSSDCKSAKVMVQLPENTTNYFKLTIDGAWKGNAAITAANNVATLTDGENATIESTKAGGYIFSYSYVTGELTVIYPGEYTLDLGELAPNYGSDGVQLADDNYNEITIYNLQDEEYKYGEEFEAEASIKHNGEWLTLTGKASWTLADGVMTLVATNMVDEDNSVNYTITATALAPQEYTIVCNGTYEEEVTEYFSTTKYTATTEDEDVIVIEIGVYGSGEEQEISAVGEFNENWFSTLQYTIEEGEDGVRVLTATATDEAGNTYIITMTATKAVYPEINIYNATVVSMEEGSLMLSASYEGKAVSFELYQNWMGEFNAMLEIGEWEEEGYMSCMSDAPALEEEDGDYTVTGIFTDDFEKKYIITITTKANPATGLDNVTSTVAPVKVIENNQLIIIKNGVRYNVMGATVK